MIYVIEIPEARLPSAWFAYDDDDLARKVAASDPLDLAEIYDEITPSELLALLGHVDDTRGRAAYPSICEIGDTLGWDIPLYRADYLLGRGVCQPTPVSRRAALAAALAAREARHLIYWNDSDALAAFEGGDARLASDINWTARRALYEQLVALEVLADDI